MPTSEIVRKTIDAQPILYIRKEVDPSKLADFFAENFTKIFTYAILNSCEIAGNPMARYIKVGQGLWTVDAILPLLKAEHGEEEIISGALHGGFVATATHSGPYETLPETYSAIDQWVQDNGYTALGENWEWYITDPGQHPDPNDWKTQVYWPLAD